MRTHALALLVCLLAVGCGGGGSSNGGGGHGGPTDLTVTGVPKGVIDGPIHIALTFSRPMVAADQIDKPVASPPLTVVPPIPGDAKWTDDKTLIYMPKADLPLSTKFVVTVPEGTKSLDGHELGAAFTWDFSTPLMTGSFDVLGSDQRAVPTQAVHLSFDTLVAFEQVTKLCHFNGDGKQIAVDNGPQSPSGPARAYTIVPASPLPLNTDFTLTCDAGLHGVDGNLGLDKPIEQKLHTYGPLHFLNLDPKDKDLVPDENTKLSLVFTNPLKAPYQMKITPAITGFPDRCHTLDSESTGLSCEVPLDPLTSYTISIDAAQTDQFGQALGAPQTVAFKTTNARPALSMESGYFIAELKRPVLPVWTRNVKSIDVTAVEITQETFQDIRPLITWWEAKPADFSKSKLVPKHKTISVAGTENKWNQHPLDAKELFNGTPGPGMFYVELGAPDVDADDLTKVLVNFTDIGVVSKLSGSRGLVWATRLSTGKPLPGATVNVRDSAGNVTWTGTTDADGIAITPGTAVLSPVHPAAPAKAATPALGSDGLDPGGEHYTQEGGGGGGNDNRGGAGDGDVSSIRIFVSSGADWTMVNPSRTNGLAAWNFNVSVDSDRDTVKLRGFMHTDRGLYRPGEKVHVKGLARISKLGAPLETPGEGKKVSVTVSGPQGKTFFQSEAKLSPFGGFWFDIDLPGDARLGDYNVNATMEGGSFTREFTVEEYRPATFEVSGKTTTASVERSGTVRGSVSANYFYGAPVRGATVATTIYSRARYVSFPGYDGYDFSDNRRTDGGYRDESSTAQNLVTEDHGIIDDKGNAALAINVGPNDLAYDADLLVKTSVTAPSNEVASKTFTVPYFHATTYFGVKTPGYFADVNKPQTYQVVAVGADGKPVSATAKVTISRRDWNCVWEDWGYRGNYQCTESLKVMLTKSVPLAGGKPGEVVFTADGGGDYLVVAEADNDKEKDTTAVAAEEVYAWGDGGGSWKSTDSMTLDIVADKKEYKAGDTATLLLKTDLAQATGLVTIERDGVIEKRMITLTPKQKHLEVPITNAYAPNVYVSVALVQGRMGDGSRGKPRMRMGIIDLSVRPQDNVLTVAIETDKKDYRPGELVTATVKVTDGSGKPASAEVSITASDEGVLSLIGYETPNPTPTFYAPWGLGVTTATQFEYIRDIPGANQQRPATGGDSPGTLRSRFVSTAVWTPGAVTDASGVATVKFTAPDNLTAFRVMALAADRGHRFGSADKRFTVSKPLQLLASLPRFLNVGDQLQGGVVVNNDTGAAGTATIKVVSDAHVTIEGGAERTIDIAKGARVPVLFAMTAATPGEADFKFSITMNSDSDAVELKLPVIHPSPIRTDQLAMGLAKGVTKIAVPMPDHAIPGSAEVIVSVDPDGLSGIDDGLVDLVHYPYGCLEQTTSQMIPMIAVRDLADSLAIDGLTGPALEAYVRAGITKIGKHQTPYGGFSLWPGGDPDTYYTAYALWGLYLARQAGYPVDASRIDEGLDYLRNDGVNPNQARPHYHDTGARGSQAFALYVRAVLGDKTAAAAVTTLLTNGANIPIYGDAFLARALAASLGAKDPAVVKLVRELSKLADESAKSGKLIEEPEQRNLWAYMSSPSRTTAAVLMALVELDPKNAAIPGLVTTIMSHRASDHYESTQSNLYELLALSAYAKTLSSGPASVTVTMGGAPLLAGALTGKQRIRRSAMPLTAATEVAITPTGHVHYNVEVRYRRTTDTLKAETNGITLQQEYLDEAGKPKSSFTVGDVVRVRLTTDNDGDRDHLMISDALPAGFEVLNTRFNNVGETGVVQTSEWGSEREIHDDRVDFASEYASRGHFVHEFSMRATSVGKFGRPPTVAELMYEPGVHSQTAYDVLEIKAK